MAWGLAGLTKVCKTFRKGFDSLPRLHFEKRVYHKEWSLEPPGWRRRRINIRFELGRGVGIFAKRYTREELEDLILYHHKMHSEKATEAMNLRDRLIEAQKELSRYKRGAKSAAPE